MAQSPNSQGSIQTLRHESTLLRDNPLGDPNVRDVIVYLPPGYEEGDTRYPVVYCLTGFSGRGKMLLNDSTFTPNMAERMDRLIAATTIRPMIVVMPDCFTRVGGSQYINSTATGRYEDYLTQEILPFVDENFRTLAHRDSRAVMGKSSGGYGALIMGMRHSDQFGLVCSTSGDMYFEFCYQQDICTAFRTIKGDPKVFLEKFWSSEKKGKDEFSAFNIIGMSACYSPDGSDYDLIFDLQTGALREEIVEKWLRHDPVRMMDSHMDNLASLGLLFLDAGTKDEFFLDIGARILSKQLRDYGIDHIHEEFDDGHFNISYRYDRSLELISEKILTAETQSR